MIGKERIAAIVGDREFIGVEWIKYLKKNKIPFCMRLPKHHLVSLKNGQVHSITQLLSSCKECYFHDCLVDGVIANVDKSPA